MHQAATIGGDSTSLKLIGEDYRVPSGAYAVLAEDTTGKLWLLGLFTDENEADNLSYEVMSHKNPGIAGIRFNCTFVTTSKGFLAGAADAVRSAFSARRVG
ncbi:MAG: hypothetical protein VR70_10685 [Rhodospirillaceae bacterium BRH_c57]|nr:MAG: hypothetical protein VR70_10685 [Rhodospirillaceae bacterium BRH_c57]